MIKLQDMTPEVYYQRSRDFQFIGRLYDIALNSIKTNADMIYSLPLSDNSDTKLIDLMTMTLGFKSKHNYNIKQLTALCSAFTYILRNKGSITAIETACNVLLHAEGITREIVVEQPLDSSGLPKPELILYIPEELTDLNLLKDLLTYIVPAGTQISVVLTSVLRTSSPMQFVSTDSVRYKTWPFAGLYAGVIDEASASGPAPDYMEDEALTIKNGYMANGAVVNEETLQ